MKHQADTVILCTCITEVFFTEAPNVKILIEYGATLYMK